MLLSTLSISTYTSSLPYEKIPAPNHCFDHHVVLAHLQELAISKVLEHSAEHGGLRKFWEQILVGIWEWHDCEIENLVRFTLFFGAMSVTVN
jgi:hypothetical protein